MNTIAKLNPWNADRDPRLVRNLGLIGLLVLVIVVAGALVVYALQPPDADLPASGLILTWHREGGLAGFCDEVTIYHSGDVYVSSCQGDPIGHVQLDAEQLATLYGWVDSIRSFEYEDADPAMADGMTVRLLFSGSGEQPAQGADKLLMSDLAQSLYNEVWILGNDASAVCPTPGVGQQLLLDRKAGYCLLYPAGYSLVQTIPGTNELIVGSLLNHTQPRLSIAIEKADGRSLEEVAAQLEAEYVPAGWVALREYLTVDGVEAVVLDNLPGQDLNRRMAFLHDNHLYTLFLTPIGEEGSELREQAEMLFRPVLDSFRFLTEDAPPPLPATNAGDLQPIQFAPGSSSVTVEGTAVAMTAQRYLLQGLGGQNLAVVLETISMQTYITVLTPKGENMAGADGPIHQWAGRLPIDGSYVIEVINPGGDSVEFELNTTLTSAPPLIPGESGEPVKVLIQLDWEGGFAPPEISVPFGRVPAFTLLADGRVFYVDSRDPQAPNQEQLLVAQLTPDETQGLLQQVLDLGFERLESHLEWCQQRADGRSECVADAGYSILRVRLPSGNLREIRNWADFANDPEALLSIRGLLSEYHHADAVPYLPERASLFVHPIPSAESVTGNEWPLNRDWLAPPSPGVEQWAGVLSNWEWDALLRATLRNMGTHYFRSARQSYRIVLVPWLPGTDYTDLAAGYRWPRP